MMRIHSLALNIKTPIFRQPTGSGVLELEILILELGAVDGLATGSVVVGEVTTLTE